MNSTENELPAIDLEADPIPGQSLQDAQEFLLMYLERLPDEKKTLESCYLQSAWHELAKIAHRLFGATCYVGAPAIRQALFDLEKSAKTSDVAHIETAYIQWIKEYERLFDAAKKMNLPLVKS